MKKFSEFKNYKIDESKRQTCFATKYKGKVITNDLDYLVAKNYECAVKLGKELYGWNEDDIVERKEKLSLELDGKVTDLELPVVYVDSGSVDYIYYLKN